VAYGLENRKLPKEQVERRVAELLGLVGLPEVRDKFPAQLSGGMQQRIALARALATSPGLLLLDEPLSALDAKVRVALRSEIKGLQRQVGVTTVYVTHDQEEALVMADRIVVMNRGRIEQVGTAEQIYRSPATPFVANFVGLMNFLPGVAGPGEGQVQCGELVLQAEVPEGLLPGSGVSVAVRPEDVRVTGVQPQRPNLTPATVEEAEFLGSFYRLVLQLQGLEEATLVAEVSNNLMRDMDLQPGSPLEVQLPPHLIRVYTDHERASE
jgi:iron(III) transport system ATP-binding protein